MARVLVPERFELGHIHLKGRQCHIEKNRHQTVLDNWVDGSRKTSRNGNDLIARLQSSVAELGRRESSQARQDWLKSRS